MTPTVTLTATQTPLACATTVGGSIVEDTVWTLAGSPYCLTSSALVQPGATLYVEPGVVVQVDRGLGIRVEGALVARGTPESPIVFTAHAAYPSRGDWGGIHFAPSSLDATFDEAGEYVGGSVLQHAVVEFAGGSSVGENGAVRVEGSSPWIDRATVRQSRADGIHAWSGSAPRITGNTVADNAGRGIHLSWDTGGAVSLIVVGNTSTGNGGEGVYAYSCAGALTLADNTVTAAELPVFGSRPCAEPRQLLWATPSLATPAPVSPPTPTTTGLPP